MKNIKSLVRENSQLQEIITQKELSESNEEERYKTIAEENAKLYKLLEKLKEENSNLREENSRNND